MSDPTRVQTAAPAAATTPPPGVPAGDSTREPGGRADPGERVVPPPGYDPLAEVGRGGMGVVYRARDQALDREVAVKLLHHKYAPGSPTAGRFVDEARITAQLQHPAVPAVYQVGALADGRPYLAMKLIKGETLDALLKSNAPLDPLGVFEAVCQAVGYAHAHGVIHRDLKPGNVMVGGFGEVQVMDWGLAKVLTSRPLATAGACEDPDATASGTEIRSARGPDMSYTQYGSVLGTPSFMAPEQAAGETDKINARSDVFGLGAILCVLLTGRPPFTGADAEGVRLNAVRGKTEEAFARLDASGGDPGVVALCKRCLAFEPADRPGSANEVAAAVASFRRAAADRARQAERDRLAAEVREGEQRKRRLLIQWAAAAIAVVLAVGLSVSLWQAKVARREASDAETARVNESREKTRAEEALRAEGKQRQEAIENERTAEGVVRFFEERVVTAARPKGTPGGLGKDVSLRDAIAASVPYLGTDFADRPRVEARIRATLGETLFHLGEHKAAAEQFDRARAICVELHHPNALKCMLNLAQCHQALGRREDALKLREEVLAARRRTLPPDHPDTLASMWGVARCLAECDRGAEAIPVIDDCLRRAAGKPVNPRLMPGVALLRLRHFSAAGDLAGCRATAEMWEKLDRRDPTSLTVAAHMSAAAAGVAARANKAAAAAAAADRAMEWLTRAVAAGFRDRPALTAVTDFDSLRDRPDFQKLLASLPHEALPPPRPER
jgi:serine/threonine protein kinase